MAARVFTRNKLTGVGITGVQFFVKSLSKKGQSKMSSERLKLSIIYPLYYLYVLYFTIANL